MTKGRLRRIQVLRQAQDQKLADQAGGQGEDDNQKRRNAPAVVEQSGEGYDANRQRARAQRFHKQNNRRKDEAYGGNLNPPEGGLDAGHAFDVIPNGVNKKDEQSARGKDGKSANQSAQQNIEDAFGLKDHPPHVGGQ